MHDSPDYKDTKPRRRRDSSSSISSQRSEERQRRDRNDYKRKDTHGEGRHGRDRGREKSPPLGSHRQRSPRSKRTDRSAPRSRSPVRRSRGPLPSQNDTFQNEVGPVNPDQPPKQKPNYKPTGLLAKEANTVAGTTIVLKYHEPTEGRKPPPSQQWRMYVFKRKDLVDTVYLFERSCWLIGRDEKVTDLYLEHPSISKQHAVIQFRHSYTLNEFGDKINRVKPYLIDLESANGTKLNNKAIGQSRYVELVDGDVISFGNSEREYVMMLPEPDKK